MNFSKQTSLAHQEKIMSVLFFLLILAVVRTFYLQVIVHDKYKTRTERLMTIKQSTTSSVNIRDLNNDLLVHTIPTYDIKISYELAMDATKLMKINDKYELNLGQYIDALNPIKLEKKRPYLLAQRVDTWKIKKLKKIKNGFIIREDLNTLNDTTDILWKDLIQNKYIKTTGELTRKFLYIKKSSNLNIDYDQHEKDAIYAVLNKARDRFSIHKSFRNHYCNGDLACHFLGIKGDDNGLSGIEAVIDLQEDVKKISHQYYIKDRRGRIIDTKQKYNSSQYDVKNIQLTIDSTLQSVVEMEILKFYENAESPPKKIIVILQEPRSGMILTYASYPNFNANLFTSKKKKIPDLSTLFNSLIQFNFEPGSTLKLITFAIAIEEKLFKFGDVIDCERGKWFYSKNDRKPIKDHGNGYGKINFETVFQKSSNIGTAKIAQKIGKEKFFEYIQKFGLGQHTNINLRGEDHGILQNVIKWSQRSLLSISYGQGIAVTPIQLISVYSVIANGGFLVQPKIFLKNVKKNNPYIRKVLSRKTVKQVKKLLVKVVEDGTGQEAKVNGYSVGGKTGTAQKVNSEKTGYSNKKHISSFCGFLPVKYPKVVCLVIMDEPDEKRFWASQTAAPLFKNIMQKVASILCIQ